MISAIVIPLKRPPLRRELRFPGDYPLEIDTAEWLVYRVTAEQTKSLNLAADRVVRGRIAIIDISSTDGIRIP